MKFSKFSRPLAMIVLAVMACATANAEVLGLMPAFAALGVNPGDVLLGMAGVGMIGQVAHYDEADLPALSQVAQVASAAGTAMREDAPIFFAQQLNYVRTRLYERRAPAMRWREIVPVTTDVPEWAETVTQRSFDEVGMAKVIANYGDDLPRADVSATETLIKVKDVGNSYGYNVAEMRASEATGAQLDVRKGNAAAKAHDVKAGQLAMVGEAVYGLFGLLNHPNIGTTVGLTGDWGNVARTGQQILSDLEIIVAAVPGQSKGTHRVTRIAMADTDLNRLSTKFIADTGGKTVRAVFRENHPEITLVGLVEFRGVGTAGANLLVAAEYDPENYSFDMVMPFNQLPAQARNLEFVVPCLSRMGGVNVTYPLALTKANV